MPQYTMNLEGRPEEVSYKLTGMRETILKLPNMKYVMQNTTQAVTKMTRDMGIALATNHVNVLPSYAPPNQRTLHINQGDTGAPKNEGRDMLLWQQRPECNWDTGLTSSAGQTPPLRELPSMINTEEVRGMMMPVTSMKVTGMILTPGTSRRISPPDSANHNMIHPRVEKMSKCPRRTSLPPELEASYTEWSAPWTRMHSPGLPSW